MKKRKKRKDRKERKKEKERKLDPRISPLQLDSTATRLHNKNLHHTTQDGGG